MLSRYVPAGNLGTGELLIHVTGGLEIPESMIRPTPDPVQAELLRRKQDRVVQGR